MKEFPRIPMTCSHTVNVINILSFSSHRQYRRTIGRISHSPLFRYLSINICYLACLALLLISTSSFISESATTMRGISNFEKSKQQRCRTKSNTTKKKIQAPRWRYSMRKLQRNWKNRKEDSSNLN